MIELSAVSKRFGSHTALQTTDLTVTRGQTTVLIGPSGCGKSTTLRLIMGLIQPDAGSVSIDGTLLAAHTARSLRHRMGYVTQGGALFPHLTARVNATLMASYLKWDPRRINDRLDWLVELTHFPRHGLDRYPAQLSGGQLQRVSLMRALMLDPDLLLLDEPLGALDPMIRAELQDELRTIFSTLGKTVLLVTHDLGEAVLFADTIVLMRKGSIVQEGSPHNLLNEPTNNFVRAFVNAQRSPLAALQEETEK